MILYLDCSSGVSGDMLVGALLVVCGDDGGPAGALDGVVRPALVAAGIDPALVGVEQVRRGGMAALGFRVADAPGFATFAELIGRLESSALERPVVEAVADVARRLSRAEAEVHGSDVEHLHELSDLDTAVDLISVVTLVRRLAPERVIASPPALGGGTVRTAHGELSVPVPAVMSLLRGLPTAGGASPVGQEPPGELTTPTGAALLASLAGSFGGLPAGTISRSGCGAGRREVPGRPNLLRAVLVEPVAGVAPAALGGGGHALLECNIDDMSPELLAGAAESLRAAGACDVWVTPVVMKKGRSGVVLHVLAADEDVDRLAEIVFAESSSFGLRVSPVRRLYAEERREKVLIGGHPVGVRLGYVRGRLVTVSPEYGDVRRVADVSGRPACVVYEAVQAAARDRFSVP